MKCSLTACSLVGLVRFFTVRHLALLATVSLAPAVAAAAEARHEQTIVRALELDPTVRQIRAAEPEDRESLVDAVEARLNAARAEFTDLRLLIGDLPAEARREISEAIFAADDAANELQAVLRSARATEESAAWSVVRERMEAAFTDFAERARSVAAEVDRALLAQAG